MNKDACAQIERPEEALARVRRAAKMLEDQVRMLEAENARLADLLKQQGCPVQSISCTAAELPPEITVPLDAAAEDQAGLDRYERALLGEIRQGQPLFFLMRSDTRVDVGHWFSRGALWVAATADGLLLLAHGRKPCLEKIPFRFLGQSLYNHVTGEVVLSPALEARTQTLRLPPVEGYQLLAQIYGGQLHA